jgi:hypothetical protein
MDDEGEDTSFIIWLQSTILELNMDKMENHKNIDVLSSCL